jgi:hypothetical protein
MFPDIGTCLRRIPREMNIGHTSMYIQCMSSTRKPRAQPNA